ncbi:MAG: beta-galactosidase, partial [Anaerolineae bacterium]
MAVKTVPIALHYFRLPRPAWELMLTRMRQLGATTIFTPVPWGFHQLAEDRVDLRGLTNPRRDLAGFVDVCLAMRFRVRLELAPAPDDDLLHGGLPGRLLNRNPEIRAKDRAGHPLPTPSMGHPTYLKRLEGWFNELARVLAGKVSPGGPVEPQFTPGDPGLDFNDHAATVQWPIWLRKRYAEGGIDALNAAYAPPGEAMTIEAGDTPCFRLLLTGQAERVIPNGNAVPYIHTGPAGHTDFYFTLPNPDAPLTGPPGDYLASLLAGQQHALSHSLALTQQLLAACQPPPPPSGAPAPAPLSEAQAALT